MNYIEKCESASKEQGIDSLVKELASLGIPSTSAQTGGFTMCAHIVLKDNQYIFANSYGASLYGEDDFIETIYQNESEGNEEARIQDVARGVAQWIGKATN